MTVADPGEGPGEPAPPPPYFWTIATKLWKGKNKMFESGPPPYLQVWIRYWMKRDQEFVDNFKSNVSSWVENEEVYRDSESTNIIVLLTVLNQSRALETTYKKI